MFRRTAKQGKNNPQQATTTNPTEGRYSYFHFTLNYLKCPVYKTIKTMKQAKKKKKKFVSLTRGTEEKEIFKSGPEKALMLGLLDNN